MGTYLRTLDEIGYTGPLTIEREIPEQRDQQKADIGKAVALLTELKEQLA
jgi:sugar phosphate isomerase/epimerase